MPAVSQQQREFLNWKKGHAWVKAHHFDNKGKLPHTHHEDEDEKKKKDKEEESMDVARVRLMRMVLEFEKSHGKKLSEDEEKFLAEDISTVDIGPGPSTRRIRRKEDEEEDERDPNFIARRNANLRRKKVPNPAHDRLA